MNLTWVDAREIGIVDAISEKFARGDRLVRWASLRSTHRTKLANARFRFRRHFSVILVVVAAVAGSGVRQSAGAEPATEVTIKGNVLCNRATEPKDWFWDPKDGDHTPVIY